MTCSVDTKMSIILLVEDNPADADLVSMAFENAKEFSEFFVLKVVDNGQAAIDYLRRRGEFSSPKSSPRPDIIFMDICLPVMDGKMALFEIKNDSLFQPIPVVMLSTSNTERDITESYSIGANAYITKPVNVDDYMWMIQSTAFYWLFMVNLPSKNDYSRGFSKN